MNYIDSPEDHIDRPIDSKHVNAMALLAATTADGTVLAHPIFVHHVDQELYAHCVCGKEIKYNHTAYCLQTRKAFVLGSECIERVCSQRGYTLLRECHICHDFIETGAKCKECSLMRRRRNNRVGVGKHSDCSYMDILAIPSYKRWLMSQDEVSGKLGRLQEWLLYVESYPSLLKEDIDDSDMPAIAHTNHNAKKITFGKHNGRSYEEMVEKEKGYCVWVLSQESPSGPMKDFKEWLKSR